MPFVKPFHSFRLLNMYFWQSVFMYVIQALLPFKFVILIFIDIDLPNNYKFYERVFMNSVDIVPCALNV